MPGDDSDRILEIERAQYRGWKAPKDSGNGEQGDKSARPHTRRTHFRYNQNQTNTDLHCILPLLPTNREGRCHRAKQSTSIELRKKGNIFIRYRSFSERNHRIRSNIVPVAANLRNACTPVRPKDPPSSIARCRIVALSNNPSNDNHSHLVYIFLSFHLAKLGSRKVSPLIDLSAYARMLKNSETAESTVIDTLDISTTN